MTLVKYLETRAYTQSKYESEELYDSVKSIKHDDTDRSMKNYFDLISKVFQQNYLQVLMDRLLTFMGFIF